MSLTPGKIYLGSICIEPRKWAGERTDLINLTEWIPTIADTGFDGVEIWEGHAMTLDQSRLDVLKETCEKNKCPIDYFSTYVKTFHAPENLELADQIDQVARFLDVKGYKFNTSSRSLAPHQKNERKDLSPQQIEAEEEEAVSFLNNWAQNNNVLFVDECHRGGLTETPEKAVEFQKHLDSQRFGLILHSLDQDDEEAFQKDLEMKVPFLKHVHVAKADRMPDRFQDRVKQVIEKVPNLTWTIEFTVPSFKKGTPEQCFEPAVEVLHLLRNCLNG